MINIAVDGPAGAGKSTIAKAVSKELEYIYVDTGALYRAIGLYAKEHGADTKSAEEVSALLSKIDVGIKFVDGEQRVFINGEDVSDKIRTPEISMAASDVSAIPAVREFLFELQKKLARENNVIMDGRDIGTVVLPNADIKIFLTASPEERAKRRFDELVIKGQSPIYEDVLKDIIQRDYNDSHREIAPLKQADDAVLADTTGKSLEEAVELIKGIISERLGDNK